MNLFILPNLCNLSINKRWEVLKHILEKIKEKEILNRIKLEIGKYFCEIIFKELALDNLDKGDKILEFYFKLFSEGFFDEIIYDEESQKKYKSTTLFHIHFYHIYIFLFFHYFPNYSKYLINKNNVYKIKEEAEDNYSGILNNILFETQLIDIKKISMIHKKYIEFFLIKFFTKNKILFRVFVNYINIIKNNHLKGFYNPLYLFIYFIVPILKCIDINKKTLPYNNINITNLLKQTNNNKLERLGGTIKNIYEIIVLNIKQFNKYLKKPNENLNDIIFKVILESFFPWKKLGNLIGFFFKSFSLVTSNISKNLGNYVTNVFHIRIIKEYYSKLIINKVITKNEIFGNFIKIINFTYDYMLDYLIPNKLIYFISYEIIYSFA